MEAVAFVSAVCQLIDCLAKLSETAGTYIIRMKNTPSSIQATKFDSEHLRSVLPKLKHMLDRKDRNGILNVSEAEAELGRVMQDLLKLTCELSVEKEVEDVEDVEDGVESCAEFRPDGRKPMRGESGEVC